MRSVPTATDHGGATAAASAAGAVMEAASAAGAVMEAASAAGAVIGAASAADAATVAASAEAADPVGSGVAGTAESGYAPAPSPNPGPRTANADDSMREAEEEEARQAQRGFDDDEGWGDDDWWVVRPRAARALRSAAGAFSARGLTERTGALRLRVHASCEVDPKIECGGGCSKRHAALTCPRHRQGQDRCPRIRRRLDSGDRQARTTWLHHQVSRPERARVDTPHRAYRSGPGDAGRHGRARPRPRPMRAGGIRHCPSPRARAPPRRPLPRPAS